MGKGFQLRDNTLIKGLTSVSEYLLSVLALFLYVVREQQVHVWSCGLLANHCAARKRIGTAQNPGSRRVDTLLLRDMFVKPADEILTRHWSLC